MSEKKFPILGTNESIDWNLIASHEKQAMENHCGQTLEQLARRHGLSWYELLYVLLDKPFTEVEYDKEKNYKELCQRALISEEVKQYRAIGTPEECRAAMEKQTAKQIIDNTPTEDDMWYQCPACKGDLTKIRTFFCPYCGQRLSWNGKQYCCTCTWYDVDNGVCCNGENEHNRNLDDTCEKWEENEE